MLLKFVLDKFTDGFYFGSGGIGDALLLLSSIHKNKSNLKTNIVFWADNKQVIEELFSIFKKNKDIGINKTLIYNGFQNKEQYDIIVNHENFKGKCHFPDNIDFVNEWYNNFQKYHNEFDKNTNFIKHFLNPVVNGFKDKHIIGVGVFGSQKEAHKIKHLNTEDFNKLISKLKNKYPDSLIFIFGSKKDKENFPILYEEFNGKNIYDYRMENLEDAIKYIMLCNKFISTDTWYKTLAHFLNIPTVVINTIYKEMTKENKNEYMQNIFGKGITHDPGNDIFLLNGWNYSFVDRDNFDNV